MYNNELNSAQDAIIKHTEGSILVLAPVGTGKTRVLTERVLCAINRGVLPQRILCLTFTNRAAKEMNERLSQYCPNQLHNLTIKTFHGLCTSTLDIANRFVESDRYNLEALAKYLNLSHLPSHKAMDDVRTTIDLLAVLIPLIEHKAHYRQALVYRYGGMFEEFAKQMDNWRDTSQTLRPAYLVDKLLMESGLYSYYQAEENRLKNLLYLVQVFQDWDESNLHPDTSLRSILEFIALAKNLDQVSQDDNQVPIITIHQSKGLEFDSVFIAGATEGEFPSYFSVRDNKLEEERRLFYVAMTRAKKKLFISAYLKDSRGFSKMSSKFINQIAKEYISE